MLMFKETTAVCSENNMQHVTINTFCKKKCRFSCEIKAVIQVLLQILVL